MINMKAEIKACLISNLEAKLDPYMAEHDFKRRKASLVYKRVRGGATQTIDIPIQIHPREMPNATAAIYPFMEVHIPAVDEVLDDMISGNMGLMEGVTGGKSNQPIGFTSEKRHTGRWYAYQPDSIADIVDEIHAVIVRWAKPFLDGYVTPEDIIAIDQSNDGRLVRDRAQMMRVVAAALVCNQPDYAQALMEKWLGATGLLKRYKQVYDYIQNYKPELP